MLGVVVASALMAAQVGFGGGGYAPSASRAITDEYNRYVAAFRQSPPQDLGGFYKAGLSWQGLLSAPANMPAWALPAGRTRSTAVFSNGQISLTVDRVSVSGHRAVAIVTKRVSGVYRPDPAQPAGALVAVSHDRHMWMNDGSRWLLMTAEPISASVTLNGQVFKPDKQLQFDPNRAFKMDEQTPLTPRLPNPGKDVEGVGP